MNIKTKLSIQFTIIVFGILLFFSVLVYYFSFTSQRANFRQNLLVEAQNSAILLINVVEVDSTLLQKIQQTTKSLDEVEIAITDSTGRILYSHGIKNLNGISAIRKSGSTFPEYITNGVKDGIHYRHRFDNQAYYVTVMAYDKYRAESLKNLRKILFWCILFSAWLSISASYFFSQSAIKPISRIISSVKQINALKLSNRLDEGRGKDEIEQLATTFNEMLADLEQAFKSQDEFVSNASHELRTPLAVMIAESDYILTRPSTSEQYVEHISGIVKDLRKLNQLINGMLELAHLKRGSVFRRTELHMDEPVTNAIQSAKAKYPNRKILLNIEYLESHEELLIRGNFEMLEIAFRNLIDNALKFSENEIEVKISETKKWIQVRVRDRGIGIPTDEMQKILNPFERGSNARFKGGYGIGLSLVRQIVRLHNAELFINSNENVGTTFEICFNKEAAEQV
mgnify:CR=1 FL=1|jgi:signal transduction histidine kinase